MFFNSIEYLIFLPLVVWLYFSTDARRRWMILLVASSAFYMYFIPKYILVLFLLIVIDYFMARKIEKQEKSARRKQLLILSILANFGILIYFKYSGYFASIINDVLNNFFTTKLDVKDEILPIGLSFHTFQSVSYVIDVYRKKIKPQTHIGIYACYVLYFPQMVAGPIEKYERLGKQIEREIQFSWQSVRHAIPLLLTGFFYKMVIADNAGSYVNQIYQETTTVSSISYFLAIVIFSIQIYADFFGYSLIAQGSSRLFGITLMDNFKFPFYSNNLYVFWKKWHISLTDWFREYVYFPLGGNRIKQSLQYRNILIVFFLSGLWHGAGNNFLIWGLLHGLFYLLVSSKPIAYQNLKIVGTFFTFILVAYLFVFFRATDLNEALKIIKGSLRFDFSFPLISPALSLTLVILSMFVFEYFAKRKESMPLYLSTLKPFSLQVLCYLFVFLILTCSGTDNIPFIYFQF